jgi:glutamyl-tRNA synthetase
MPYRGRIAPSPTGYLHIGHAATFWIAQQRAIERGGQVVLRVEDLDVDRCKAEFRSALFEDMEWFGLRWHEDPAYQSQRREHYLAAWRKLKAAGVIYPCTCSRRDVQHALGAPHATDDEPIYPGACRGRSGNEFKEPAGINWRFRVHDGEEISYLDQNEGHQRAIAGVDFGDFVVWRKDDIPSYQLAVVVDDAAMDITEVVRGADLLSSTFRQLLLYRELGLRPPDFFHAPLVRDEEGNRLAKRLNALSLRALREAGRTPAEVLRMARSDTTVAG